MPKNAGKPASAPANSAKIIWRIPPRPPTSGNARAFASGTLRILILLPHPIPAPSAPRQAPPSTSRQAKPSTSRRATAQTNAEAGPSSLTSRQPKPYQPLALDPTPSPHMALSSAELDVPAYSFDASRPTMPDYVLFNSCSLEEMEPAPAMDPNTIHLFYWFIHPFVSDLVPFARRAAHVEANTPEVLLSLFRRALPFFEKYHEKGETTPKSPLLGRFVHTLCRLVDEATAAAAERPDVLNFDASLAPTVHEFLKPHRFHAANPLPLNFDLPGISCRRSDANRFFNIETFPYSRPQRAEIAPFCVKPFLNVFCLLRAPQRITDQTAEYIFPPFLEAMDFLIDWLLKKGNNDFSHFQARLLVAVHKCLDRFAKYQDVSRWKRQIPTFDVAPLTHFYSLARTTYPPWKYGTSKFSNVHPLWKGEPPERDPNYNDFITWCQLRMREVQQAATVIDEPIDESFPGDPPAASSAAGPSRAKAAPDRPLSPQSSPAAPRRFNRMGRNAGSEAPVSAPVSRGPPTPTHVQTQPSAQRPSSPPRIEVLPQPPSDEDEELDMLGDGFRSPSEDVSLINADEIPEAISKLPSTTLRRFLAIEVVVPRAAEVYKDRMQKQPAAPSNAPSAPASAASVPASAKIPTPGPQPSPPQSPSRHSSADRTSVPPPVKSPSPPQRKLRVRPPVVAPPAKSRSAKHTKRGTSAAKRAAPHAESDDEASQSSRPAKRVKLSTAPSGFPLRERKRRGESSNKLTARTALDPPPLRHTELLDATSQMERATSSSTLLSCHSCICFNKRCKAKTTGEKCESCKYAMCSHSLTTDQLHKRIQGMSEHTVFSNSRLVHAMQSVRNATQKLDSLAFLVRQRQEELLSASNYLALIVRAMYRYYGRDNFEHLWSVPGALQQIFSNYVLHITKNVVDDDRVDETTLNEVRNRWGYEDVEWTAEDEDAVQDVLSKFQDLVPEPDDELYVGPFCAQRLEEPEDEDEEMQDADGDDESSHHSAPIASSSKSKAARR
ncbi:hypothetical protein C8R46DRAFT_1232128 [Mycena filopes]|nr:hypothetical protein C8R46DRAFT_1232128 [Mycena filopes]